jgi:hypothetical protein
MGYPDARASEARLGSGQVRPIGRGTLALTAFFAGGVTGAAVVGALLGGTPRRALIEHPVASTPSTIESPQARTETAIVAAPFEPLGPPPLDPPKVDPPKAPSPSGLSGARPSASAAAVAVRPSRFGAERRLLDGARSALARGDSGEALAIVASHRAQFPVGVLTEERDAMEVEALIQAGRYTEGRARADAFKARVPNSLFGATVDSAIESIP